MKTDTSTRLARSQKTTVRIPVRGLAECAARAAAYHAQLELGLPTVDLNR